MNMVNGSISGNIYINNAVSNMILTSIIITGVAVFIPLGLLVHKLKKHFKPKK